MKLIYIVLLSTLLFGNLRSFAQSVHNYEPINSNYSVDDKLLLTVDHPTESTAGPENLVVFGSLRNSTMNRKPFLAGIDPNTKSINWSVGLEMSDSEDYDPKAITTDPLGQDICIAYSRQDRDKTSILSLFTMNGTHVKSAELTVPNDDGYFIIYDLVIWENGGAPWDGQYSIYVAGSWVDHGPNSDLTTGFILQLDNDFNVISSQGIGDGVDVTYVTDIMPRVESVSTDIRTNTQQLVFTGWTSARFDNVAFIGDYYSTPSSLTVSGTQIQNVRPSPIIAGYRPMEVIVPSYYYPIEENYFIGGHEDHKHAGILIETNTATSYFSHWSGVNPMVYYRHIRDLGLHYFDEGDELDGHIVAVSLSFDEIALDVTPVVSVYDENQRSLIQRTEYSPFALDYYDPIELFLSNFYKDQLMDEISDMHNNHLFVVVKENSMNQFRLYEDVLSVGSTVDPRNVCDEVLSSFDVFSDPISNFELDFHNLSFNITSLTPSITGNVLQYVGQCERKRQQTLRPEDEISRTIVSTSLYTIDGRLVEEVNLDNLPAGVYIKVVQYSDASIDVEKILR